MNTSTHSHTIREQQALAVFKRDVAAFTSGVLDAVMNDFGEHSTAITSDGAFEARSGSVCYMAACCGVRRYRPR